MRKFIPLCLALVLLAGLLACCNASLSTSSALPASEPAASASAPVSSGASGSLPAPSSSLPLATAHNYFEGYPPAPDDTGHFILLGHDDLSALQGNWIFWPDGEKDVSTAPAWQFRFDTAESAYIMVSKGYFETGGGSFYEGTYTLGNDGVLTAELYLLEMGELPDPRPLAVTARFKAEWAEGGALLLFTLLDYTTHDDAGAAFEADFADWAGRTIPTYLADW